MKIFFILFLTLGFASNRANAEYRAFLLKISTSGSPDFRLIKSNLDHLQYPTYYPLRAGEEIQYIETWMCRGRTNEDTEICSNPNAQPTVQPPADKG